MRMTYTPESLAGEFSFLMQRAKLDLDEGWREQMLVEFAQMREELDTIHAFANRASGPVDLRQVITFGRVEK